MNFNNNLSELYFNLNTMTLLKNEVDENELYSILEEAGLEKNMVDLCRQLSNRYLKSVIVRLKLYNRQNKTLDYIKNSLSTHQHLYPLVDYLFNTSNLEITNLENLEDSVVENLNENTDKEENPFELFLNQCILKTNKSDNVLSNKDAYVEFKKWYSSEYDDKHVPKRKELTGFLNNKLPKHNSKKNHWVNVSLV